MKTASIKSLLLLIVTVGVFAGSGYAQAANDSTSNARVSKWEPLNGANNEIIFYMPQGYESVADANLFAGKNARVDKKLTIFRFVNGVVLTATYFEGAAKQIQKHFQKDEKPAVSQIADLGGFEFNEFAGEADGYFTKTQYFRKNDRLYILKSISKAKDNRIAQDFFASVKLVKGEKILMPNVSDGTGTLTLSAIREGAQASGISKPLEEQDVDRKPIAVYMPRPKFDFKKMVGSRGGKIKLRIQVSETGTVAGVEILESFSETLNAAAMDAAQKSRYIPAEKDGNFVPVYVIQQYGFEVGTEIFIF